MLKLFFVHIDDWPDKTALYQKAEKLGAPFLEQTLQYQKTEDATLTLVGKLLLKNVLEKYYPETNLHAMQWNEKEKPFFQDGPFFNISHSGSIVLISIGDVISGVDVEKMRKIDISLFQRQFTPAEKKIMYGSQNPEEVFFRFWSIKEAAIKADGRGVEVLSQTEIINSESIKIEDIQLFYKELNLREGYKAAIAAYEVLPHLLTAEEVAFEKIFC